MKQTSFLPEPEPAERHVDPRVSRAAKTLAQAREAARRGGQRAAEHAEHDAPGWSARADMLCEMYARKVFPKSFLIEDAREFAATQGLEEPPDGRAWGHVPKRLERAEVIEWAGFAAARSSNGSPKVLWMLRIAEPTV